MNNEQKIKELEATAEQLKQQIQELKQPPKPKQWEPEGGGLYITMTGEVNESPSTKDRREFGVERNTVDAAIKAFSAMSTHNRLLAYVAEFGGDWEADWSNEDGKHYIYFNHNRGAWNSSIAYNIQDTANVYMSGSCADGLIKKLESGEVVL